MKNTLPAFFGSLFSLKKKKYLFILSIFCSFAITIIFLFLYKNQQPEIYESKYYSLGTVISIKISNYPKKNIDKIFFEIENLIKKSHIKWHPWNKNKKNILYNLNQALQSGDNYEVDPGTLNILTTSKKIADKTNHLFNPIYGQLFKAWGFHQENFNNNFIPNLNKIKLLTKSNLSMKDIIIKNNVISTNIKDPETRKIIQLDFNAIAKGQIILDIKKTLKNYNINNALINIGGDIYAMGYKNINTKSNWTSAIFNPQDKQKPIAIIKLKPNQSIATSGNYFRNFKINNKKYHHIINSKLGIPSEYFIQATVIHQDPLVADAMATVMMLSDTSNYQDFLNNLNIDNYLLIDKNNKILNKNIDIIYFS
tara:strand:- start:25745 stop:26845 length:1101 start_codon:yes stop_codon:yes gene_type:complete